MNILYIQGGYPFCYYYRGYLPGIYSDQTVVKEFLTQAEEVSSDLLQQKALLADVVCFQRPSTESAYQLAKLLKRLGKKIIFDNDDTYSGIPLFRLGNDKQREIAKDLNDLLNRFVQLADGITTSTEVLAKEYAVLNPNVAVLKNCIDPLDEVTVKKNDTGKFRVGLIGSVTTNDDYIHIIDDIKRLHADKDIQLVVLGVKLQNGKPTPGLKDDFEFWESLENIEWHPSQHITDYYYKVGDLALDLAIIPRKEHYFNQCKSNIKFLDMSLLKIPVLAQGFSDETSPYQNENDSKYMGIVMPGESWYDRIMDVKANYEHHKRIAENAHDYILKEYNIAVYAKTWTDEIKKLVNI